MPWTVETDREDRLVWTRDDGHATLTTRETAGGRWAVTLDRLEQAPEGPAYRHETVDGRERARDLAADWRESFDVPD